MRRPVWLLLKTFYWSSNKSVSSCISLDAAVWWSWGGPSCRRWKPSPGPQPSPSAAGVVWPLQAGNSKRNFKSQEPGNILLGARSWILSNHQSVHGRGADAAAVNGVAEEFKLAWQRTGSCFSWRPALPSPKRNVINLKSPKMAVISLLALLMGIVTLTRSSLG